MAVKVPGTPRAFRMGVLPNIITGYSWFRFLHRDLGGVRALVFSEDDPSSSLTLEEKTENNDRKLILKG